MGLRDLIEQLINRTTGEEPPSKARFAQHADTEGVNFVLVDGTLADLESGGAAIAVIAQYVALQMLEEQDLATRLPHGFSVAAESITKADPSIADALLLPPPYPGGLSISFDSHTGSRSFQAYATVESDDAEVPLSAKGGYIQVGRDRYCATPEQWAALAAIKAHSDLNERERDENTNVRLVGKLLHAAGSDPTIHVGHFAKGGWTVSEPTRVGVRGTLDTNGDLLLAPVLDVDVTPDLLDTRWGQLANAGQQGVLRVDKHIVSLNEEALDGVREVLANRRIPTEHVAQFLKSPSAFLNAALVDLDLGFSVRVEGIGLVQHIDFDDGPASEIDWFQANSVLSPPSVLADLLRSPDDIEAFESHLIAASVHGATAVNFADRLIDVSDPAAVRDEIARAQKKLDEPHESTRSSPGPTDEKKRVSLILRDAEDVIGALRQTASAAARAATADAAPFARTPFPHQVTGIEWILGLISAAHTQDQDDLYRLQGALLADDMGLGKTFMALAAIAQHNAEVMAEEGASKVRPTLVVAPLSLLENWEAEVEKSFIESPFSDIVVLQSDRDLRRFARSGHGRETSQAASLLNESAMIDADQIRLTLRIGASEGSSRLDQPGRLVLTTYETLRDYQFSMAQIDWGVVVYDEAQAIKNPNAMRTRAAKALRATFKLVATGTPVENSLGDFWCLIDTAQPGLLGSWETFRDTWIVPVLQASEEERESVRVELGRALRDVVGPFMLRRIKEDHIDGLPAKHIHTPFSELDSGSPRTALAQQMPSVQSDAYDEILRDRLRNPDTASNHPLAVLTRLRAVSLHPELGVHGARPEWPATHDDAGRQVSQSGKLIGLMNVLSAVEPAGEKVIVFAMSKDLQLLLSFWIQHLYEFRPHIINGDTAAIAQSSRRSRRQLIEEFEATPGFNVIIMSPIAAGTGLTVIGANHVVHLERHWNPAKEAQATDRAYRIGQTRDVHVYYPASIHPKHESFDVLIDRLLASKVTIKDAVMEQGEISAADLSAVFGFAPADR